MAKSKSSASTAGSVSSSTRSSNDGSYSLRSLLNFVSNNFALIFIVGLFFLAGFFAGSLWTENQILRKGGLAAVAPTQPTALAPTEPTGPTPDQLKKAPAVTADDYFRGNANAKVTLIEYSDFECPFCARFHPTMLKVMEEYGDKVKWVYRHYPLSFHPNAQKAGEAAECVVKQQGKDAFWKYTDAIFEQNNKLGGKLSPEAINTVAESLGVNMTAFKTCLDSGEMAEKVTQDMAGGSSAGISGTPGTIILTEDGQAELIPGALSFEQVKPMLDAYVK